MDAGFPVGDAQAAAIAEAERLRAAGSVVFTLQVNEALGTAANILIVRNTIPPAF